MLIKVEVLEKYPKRVFERKDVACAKVYYVKSSSASTASILCTILHDQALNELHLSYCYSASEEDTNFSNLEFDSDVLQNSYRWNVEIGHRSGVIDSVGNALKDLLSELSGSERLYGEIISVSSAKSFYGNCHQPDEKVLLSSFNPMVEYCKVSDFSSGREHYYLTIMDTTSSSLRTTRTHKYTHHHKKKGQQQNAPKGSVDIMVPKSELKNLLIDPLRHTGFSIRDLEAIRDYFEDAGRLPTEIELASIAQAWSEHCHHNIFSYPIDDIEEGLYNRYIKRATYEINSDICVSVFSDNAGAIKFNERWLLVAKVETHNSPSAIDPIGGAMTGILGVNRDIIGFRGAMPILNSYFFALPTAETTAKAANLFRDKALKHNVLSPQFIESGVTEGVKVGGNLSGIPTALGSVYYNESFLAKPLVYVGCVGMIASNGVEQDPPAPQDGDLIVLVGGKTGKDGIYGANFSSQGIDEQASVSMVQIGDPITQKKLSDALTKAASNLNLFRCITDNGAGGLSCSVGEMGRQGFEVWIDKVPLKHPNMEPKDVWISESQERMTLAVPEDKYESLSELLQLHEVESTIIGKFNNTGHGIVLYNNEVILDLNMEFWLRGKPSEHLHTKSIGKKNFHIIKHEKSDIRLIASSVANIMARPNVCSKSYIYYQYDYEVQARSITKPMHGPGEVDSDATVFIVDFESKKAGVKSQGFNCAYGEEDTYRMAAAAIDSAVRAYVTIGGNLNHVALLDNFCWSSSNEPEMLWKLKRACEACYDYSKAFSAPFISGKDSMFNDFHGYDKDTQKVKISAMPSILISAIGVIDDYSYAVTIDAKSLGSLIYVLGDTADELGCSEYYKYTNIPGGEVPKVHAGVALSMYKKYLLAVSQGIIESAVNVSIGGLAVALSKKLIGGQLGAVINLEDAMSNNSIDIETMLFSESQSRILVSIDSDNKERFEEIMSGSFFSQIGVTTSEQTLMIEGLTESISILHLGNMYRIKANLQAGRNTKMQV